jgi:hypothetical protein
MTRHSWYAAGRGGRLSRGEYCQYGWDILPIAPANEGAGEGKLHAWRHARRLLHRKPQPMDFGQ